MPTPYSNIYNLFLDEINDITFLQFTIEERELILKKLLLKSIPRFHACKTDLLDRNDVLEQFNQDISEEEQLILSTIMRYHWLNQQIYNIELLKQRMSTKDFKLTSQAEHLKNLQSLKNNLNQEINQMIVNYTIYNFKVSK